MSHLLWLIPLLLVALATWHDLRTREVPDWISYVLAAWGALAIAVNWSPNTWFGLAAGALLGAVLTLPFAYFGGLGGADVRLMIALGAVFGPGLLLLLGFLTAIFGGLLALVAHFRGQKDYAYCPAILASLVSVLALSLVIHGRIA